MPTLSYPFALTAGQPENVNQLTANLDAVKTVVNNLDAANLADGAVNSAKIADGTIVPGDLAAAAKVSIRQVFDLRAGPLPVNGTFTTVGGPILIIMGGSGYVPSGAGVVGFDFTLDGTNYQGSHLYMSSAGLHGATVPRFAFFNPVAAGTHTLQFYGVGMATDASDRFNCTVIELVP
jgi:hypothetical protein